MNQMKIRILAMACLASFAYTGVATAAINSKPTAIAKAAPVPVKVDLPALSAQQIVDRNISARGGLDAWERVQSMSVAGKLDAGKKRVDGGRVGVTDRKQARALVKAELQKASLGKGDAEADKVIQLPFTMEMKRPRQTRVEVQFQGNTAVQVYDGVNGWKVRPYLGRHEVEAFNALELNAASQQQELDGPLINLSAKGSKIALAGTESVDGRAAYKLALTLKTGEVRNVWIDGSSFLEIKMDVAPRRMDGKMHPVQTYFSDYKSVNGLMIPYSVETRVEGKRDAERMIVERVALNPTLDSLRFAKPE
jgi:hypothetical protein